MEDEESLLLWKQLCHYSHMELHVKGLSSGYCKDVHGQVGDQYFLVSHYSPAVIDQKYSELFTFMIKA